MEELETRNANLPETVMDALARIEEHSWVAEDKLFIARSWIRRSLSDETIIPEPVSWVFKAQGVASAEQFSRYVKTVLDHSAIEKIRYEIETIQDRLVLLDLDEMQGILGRLGIPVFFNSHYHSIDDILIVPFSPATGFSPRAVQVLEQRIADLVF